MVKQEINVFWFRRDLRLSDNAGLYHALKSGRKVLPVFCFDKNILDKLDDPFDGRVNFIWKVLDELKAELRTLGTDLWVHYGTPESMFQNLIATFEIERVFANHDYEPYATKRDNDIAAALGELGIGFHTFKDQVIFEKDEVLSDSGKPYTVFTPYSRKWKAKLTDYHLKPYPTEKYFSAFLNCEPSVLPSLELMGFQPAVMDFPTKEVLPVLLKAYSEKRNYPALPGTSRISVHLRFGTVSIRALAQLGKAHSESWLNELIWRDFYMNVLWHFPRVANSAFKPEYDSIPWRNNEAEFEKWCQGKTGYPLVDAGMRELNTTGFMHNRVRMVVASFLVKHLLIDWRWGEAYFAKKLLDFDLSANNGGWQWAAGSGVDAAPYFRIFNPKLQTEKFDPNGDYIKKWVPEYGSPTYKEIVEHSFARNRALEVLNNVLKKQKD